jgi:XrtJ-associated TM-motif-TM protein
VKNLGRIFPVVLLILAATLPLHAQVDGCVDSPENPTAVLAIVSAAGFGLSHLWTRFRGRK